MKSFKSALIIIGCIFIFGCSHDSGVSMEGRKAEKKIGNSKNQVMLEIGENYFKTIKDEYREGYEVLFGCEIINNDDKDSDESYHVIATAVDKDGYTLGQQAIRTLYIPAHDHRYAEFWMLGIEEEPADVVFSLQEANGLDGKYDPLYSQTLDEYFKLDDLKIDNVPNYGGGDGEHLEIVGSISSDLPNTPSGYSTVKVDAVFYKGDNIVGVESGYVDIQNKEKKKFSISPVHINLNSDDVFDSYDLHISFSPDE